MEDFRNGVCQSKVCVPECVSVVSITIAHLRWN
jgi:hypothetical protein